MSSKYYKLDCYGEPVPCSNIEWSRWFEDEDSHEARQVNVTKFPDAQIQVSTVFLGLNHCFDLSLPPQIFETMVFRNDSGEELQRCATRQAALIQHNEVCDMIRQELGHRTSGELSKARVAPLILKPRKIRIRKDGR